MRLSLYPVTQGQSVKFYQFVRGAPKAIDTLAIVLYGIDILSLSKAMKLPWPGVLHTWYTDHYAMVEKFSNSHRSATLAQTSKGVLPCTG